MMKAAGRLALCLIVALAMAPAVAAGLSPQGTLEGLSEEAHDAHPWAGWAMDRAAGAAGDDPDSGDEEDDGSSGSSTGSKPGSHGPVGSARPVVMVVVQTAERTLDELDPLGLVGDLGERVEPVQEAATGLPSLLFPPAESEVSEPAPATATAVEVTPASMPALIAAGTVAAAAAVAALWLAGSSGTVGAGAAGAAGAAGSGTAGKLAGTDLRRLLPFASPLFTRFEKDTVLGHPKREALYALILQDPGVSLQSLCDATGLSRTAVTHHLRLMELQHLIVSKRLGRSRHYYENGGRFGRDQKDAYAVLQNDRSKAVADFVRQNPGAIQKAICGGLAIQASVAHWHLKRLQDAQLVEAVRHGRTVSYFPAAGLRSVAAVGAPLPRPADAPAPAPTVAPLPLSA